MPNRILCALVPAIAVACTTAYSVGTEDTHGNNGPDAGAMDASATTDGDATRPDAAASFYLGADVSYVQEEEDEGRHFHDTDGTEKDIFQILKNHGFNYVRLRTFVDPLASDGYDTTFVKSTTGYCDAAHTVTMGARVKAAGMGFLLDFHLGDSWSDSTHQITPLAWQGDSFSQLVAQVQNYTNSVMTQLVAGNARPDMVQIGNEITPGMFLAPVSQGSTSNWTHLAELINAGIAGVKAVDSSIKIMLHLGLCGDNTGTRTWVDNAMSHGVIFDVLGESCYTNAQGDPSTWQANFADLAARYPTLSFIIAEYAEDAANLGGNTECPSSTGPCNVWRRANDIAFGIPGKKGLGAFIWEPTIYEEPLFDDSGQTNDPTNLPNPFEGGARIQLYDQIVTAYGL